MSTGPHAGAAIDRFGAPLAGARTAVVALHGRGASARDMEALAAHLGIAEVAYLMPTAVGRSWWPTSFLASHGRIGPYLDSALEVVQACAAAAMGEGVPPENLVVMGFSQGACLAVEYGARSQHALGAVVAFSGGLVGTGDAVPPADGERGHPAKDFDYQTDRTGTQVYLGCHESDPHIPLGRVQRSATVFDTLGATTQTDIFPGQGHGVVAREITALRKLLNPKSEV